MIEAGENGNGSGEIQEGWENEGHIEYELLDKCDFH